MVAARRVIALRTDAEQRQRLLEISRSRTEPTSRVERARIILAYLDDPSAYGGPGERIVFEPYSREPYEEARDWIAAHGIFAPSEMGGGRYEDAILAVAPQQ